VVVSQLPVILSSGSPVGLVSEARELLTTEEALLITKNGRLIGLVSRIDMVRALRDISPQE